MRSGGNNFNYFTENQPINLANLVQFKRVLMSCPGYIRKRAWPPLLPLATATPLALTITAQWPLGSTQPYRSLRQFTL